MEFEWTEDIILNLIDEVKEHPCLWDPKNKDKKMKNKKIDAFQNIAKKFGTTADIVSKKLSNLLQSYRGCRRKAKSSMVTGSGRSDIYIPSWFAYDSLNQFMQNVYTPHGTTDTIHLERNEDETQLEEDEESMRDDNNTEEILQQSSISTSPAQIVHQNAEQVKSIKQSARKRKVREEDSRVKEAFEYLKQKKEEIKKNKDEFSLFGDLIATKLRDMDKITQQYVMNDINNIMFNASLNTYYSTAQQNPNNQQTSPFQQIPPLHSTYKSNKQTPAVPPYSHTPYQHTPYSLHDQSYLAPSNSMYNHDQTTTSATHLMHPSYKNSLQISSQSAHSPTSENSSTHTVENLSQVTPHSSYLPNKNISDLSNSATYNIENVSRQVTSHSYFSPNENISNPSNSITLTTLENISQVTPRLGDQSQHF